MVDGSQGIEPSGAVSLFAVYLGQNSSYLQQKKSRADSALVIVGHPSWRHAPRASRGEAKFIPSPQKVKYFTSIVSDTKIFFSPWLIQGVVGT